MWTLHAQRVMGRVCASYIHQLTRTNRVHPWTKQLKKIINLDDLVLCM